MIIDTHVHYNLEPFSISGAGDEDWKRYWSAAQSHGVVASVIVGTDLDTSRRATIQAESDHHLYAAVGIHPSVFQEASSANDDPSHSSALLFDEVDIAVDSIRALSAHHRVIAIGEIGLDYFRLPKDEAQRARIIALQKQAFVSQLQLAKHSHLPVICHVRDTTAPEEKTAGCAYWDALDILQSVGVERFVLHCVSGPSEYVRQALAMGAYVGFDGNITYPSAEHIRDLFTLAPADRRVVETDAPYLPPQRFRGQVCEPWMIGETVSYIETALHAQRKQLLENSLQLFPQISSPVVE